MEGEIPSIKIRLIALASSILLAYLTFKFIEKPIQTARYVRTKLFASAFLISIVALVGLGIFINNGLGFRWANNASNSENFNQPQIKSCENFSGEEYGDDWCDLELSSPNGRERIALIGDSISGAYAPMLKIFSINSKPFEFLQVGRGQCPPLREYGPLFCRALAEKEYEYIKKSDTINYVVLSAAWPEYFYVERSWSNSPETVETRDSFKKAFEKTILDYLKTGKKVVVFLAPPLRVGDPKSCVVRPLSITNNNKCNFPLTDALQHDGPYRSYMIAILKDLGISAFDPFIYLCDKDGCKLIFDNRILYMDHRHMSKNGGEFLEKASRDKLSSLFNH